MGSNLVKAPDHAETHRQEGQNQNPNPQDRDEENLVERPNELMGRIMTVITTTVIIMTIITTINIEIKLYEPNLPVRISTQIISTLLTREFTPVLSAKVS